MKGCINFECFGAGQQVSQTTFEGKSWRAKPESAGIMFEVFLILKQLHELCWYLFQAYRLDIGNGEIKNALVKTLDIVQFKPQALIELDLTRHCEEVNNLLEEISKMKREKIRKLLYIKTISNFGRDFFGRDLRKKDLRCASLRGACLIAANLENSDLSGTDFTGADLRDLNIRGANLSKSLFLNQPQINSANGDLQTKLPPQISHPEHWR